MTTTTKSTALERVQAATSLVAASVAKARNVETEGMIQYLDKPAFKQMLATALPRHLTAERMLRVVSTTMRQSPALAKCEPMSVVASIVRAAQLGLEPDGTLGRAYLVPYGNECTLIVGYRGLIDLALRSDKVVVIKAECRHQADHFAYDAAADMLSHRPAEGDRGAMLGAWAMARFRDGICTYDYMPLSEIYRRRDVSKSGKSQHSPWQQWPDEMAKKTVIRHLAKRLPMAVELQHAAQQDEAVDFGHASLVETLRAEQPQAVAQLEAEIQQPAREPGAEG